MDIRTHIVTIVGAAHNTAIIYGDAVSIISRKQNLTDNEKDTMAVWRLIWKIRQACGIESESGA